MLTKYNILFNILHINFIEVEEIVISFLQSYYEERVHKQWLNSLIMNEKPIGYKEYLKDLGIEIASENEVNTRLTTDDIRNKNNEILNSFKGEWEVI